MGNSKDSPHKIMNNLDRKLIELNDALLKLSTTRGPVSPKLLEQAMQVLSGGIVDTGPGNDTVIINQGKSDCECEPGPQGEPGPMGPQGPMGLPGLPGECICPCSKILVTEDYAVTCDDYYIGVQSDEPVTITLPSDCTDCCEIIIKAEMGPPMGKRKITIVVDDGSNIDGKASYVIKVPYGSVRLICRDSKWWII